MTGASSASPLKHRDVAMSYDELGRLRSVTDTATGTGSFGYMSVKSDAKVAHGLAVVARY